MFTNTNSTLQVNQLVCKSSALDKTTGFPRGRPEEDPGVRVSGPRAAASSFRGEAGLRKPADTPGLET